MRWQKNICKKNATTETEAIQLSTNMEKAKELLIKHLKALPIGYNETEMLQCLNDKKSEEGMLLNAMLNAVTEALNIHSVMHSGNVGTGHEQ